MNHKEYMTVPCIQVPKFLFQDTSYKELTATAKLLYSLLLDRLEAAGLNEWVDEDGDCYVLYPKNDLKKDLNCTRYRVDQAILELEEKGMVLVVQGNGRPNRFYLIDITKKEEEENNTMMTMGTIMEMMTDKEREIFMDKLVTASKELMEELQKMGYLEQEEMASAMEVENDFKYDPLGMRGYLLENGKLDKDMIEEDAADFGMDLALSILDIYEGYPDKIIDISDFVNEVYEERPKRAFMTVIETMAVLLGANMPYVQDMKACSTNKKARKVFMEEMMLNFNSLIDQVMSHAEAKKE